MKVRIKSFPLFLLGLLLGLSAVAGVFFAAPKLGGSKVVFLPGGDEPVGQNGPVGVRFASVVEPANVEAYLQIEPPAAGKWSWQTQTAWFEPEAGLAENQAYTLRVREGARDGQGRAISPEAWSFRVRAAEVAYLSPALGGREVWRVAPDGTLPQQLTRTGGRAQDFSISRDGEMVYFSAGNDQGGTDVWSVERDGKNQTRLVACGMEVCDGVTVSPDGNRAAYSQSKQAGVDGQPRIFDLHTGGSTSLYADILIHAAYFNWSPDGRKLAFYDAGAGAVRVYDFDTGKDALFESNVPGPAAWSPDSRRLIYLHEDNQTGFTRVVIFQADLDAQKLQPLFENILGDDSGLPVWSPGGEELLFSQRILSGSASRQLFLIHPDGSGLKPVTDDLRYTTAAYGWSPDGQRVVFQRYAFGSSDNLPEVAVWERATNRVRLLAVNAAQPEWLP